MPKPPKKAPASGAVASEAKQGQQGPAFPVLPDGIHDLAGLSAVLGKPDETFRRLLFRNHTETEFYQWGVEAASEDILVDVPRFLSSSLRILATLSPANQALVKVPPGIFAVLADETAVDASMAESHATVSDSETEALKQREVTLKKAMGQGIAVRDGAVGGLRHAVGDPRVAPVRAAASDASTPAALAKGLRAVKAFIEGVLVKGSDDDKAALEAFGVGEACAADLEAHALAVEAAAPAAAGTSKRVSQRMLDIQDGRVLVLVDVILRAFRLARRREKVILLPELNRLAALFDTRARAAAKDAEEAPGGPEKKPT